ncbi:unnamed protein product, partial [marine sediment metagenome]
MTVSDSTHSVKTVYHCPTCDRHWGNSAGKLSGFMWVTPNPLATHLPICRECPNCM